MAKTVITQGDTFGEGWGKQNAMNTEVYDAVALNTAKDTNTVTNITVVETPTTVEIQSSDGTNDTIAAANVTNAGIMTTTMYDEHVVNTAKVSLEDNSVTLAKMAQGTDGNLITYDASGDPAYVATGTAAQVLTSNGEGAAPTFQSVNKDINTASYATDQTLTATECKGYIIYVTGAATITLPAIASGASVTVITIGTVEISIDPNASDKIVLDGTALDDGDKITNLSTAGDVAVLTYYSADGWYASTNGWTDGA